MLRGRRAVPLRELLATLEVSKATLKRDLAYLRDRHGAPIVYDRDLGGYRLDQPDQTAPRHELPGIWFSEAELHALLALYHLTERIEPGLLHDQIAPFRERIVALLAGDHASHLAESPGRYGKGAVRAQGDVAAAREVARRIRILPLAPRRVASACFETVCQALLARQRLSIRHYHRARDAESEREVSPQRLVRYRDNWYLDTWDHGKAAVRTFALDSIRRAARLDTPALDVPDTQLDAELASGYGIFAGGKTRVAKLRFSPERARWVAGEEWHPEQRGEYDNGHYILEVPYADERELLMDILKHGPEVEALAPDALRDRVRESLEAALERYRERKDRQNVATGSRPEPLPGAD